MRRLPPDLMSMIIHLLKRPLPEHGDRNATWGDLHQHDLTKMMRVSKVSIRTVWTVCVQSVDPQMTYHITAPLLYSEIVVQNMSALFHGIDDTVQPHHQQCAQTTEKQTRICNHITRGHGQKYHCSRHPQQTAHHTSRLPNGHHPSTLYHKQELLAMTKVIHLVYSLEDERVYDEIYREAGDAQIAAIEEMHTQFGPDRYTGASGLTTYLPAEVSIAPKLERMTLGSWMMDSWNARYAYWRPLGDATRLFDLHINEGYLALMMYPFEPRYLCRYSSNGPFARYLAVDNSFPLVRHNVIHNAMIGSYGLSLVPGCYNVVHFTNIPGITAIDEFTSNIEIAFRELRQAVRTWSDECVDQDVIGATWVCYCIERPHESSHVVHDLVTVGSTNDEVIEAAGMFLSQLEACDDELLEGWEWMFAVVWGNTQGCCKACGVAFGEVGDSESDDMWDTDDTESE